jgi:hypothetical protein
MPLQDPHIQAEVVEVQVHPHQHQHVVILLAPEERLTLEEVVAVVDIQAVLT